jgi:hypothetical protein
MKPEPMNMHAIPIVEIEGPRTGKARPNKSEASPMAIGVASLTLSTHLPSKIDWSMGPKPINPISKPTVVGVACK